MEDRIIKRITDRIKIPELVEILVKKLSFSELYSLLLKTFELKVKSRKLVDLLDEYQTNRFVRPSDIDPVTRRKLELKIFSMLPSEFERIELSTLTPLGTSAVMTPVHQNNVISTIRNLEVAADTTNILAFQCALKRKNILKSDRKSNKRVSLASAQRLTRGQPFKGKYFSAQFNVFALCTAGRDEGAELFDRESLNLHLEFYLNLINHIVVRKEIRSVNIKFFEYSGYDYSQLIEYVENKVIHMKKINVRVERNSEFGKGYYSGLRFAISVVNQANNEYDYVDGGFTDWTARLLNNKKERLLTSGIGTDFLLRTIKIKT
jgi:hypothetical protein